MNPDAKHLSLENYNLTLFRSGFASSEDFQSSSFVLPTQRLSCLMQRNRNAQYAAIKKSRVSLRVKRTMLRHEARVLQLLQGHSAIPTLLGYERLPHFEYIAVDLLGRNMNNAVLGLMLIVPNKLLPCSSGGYYREWHTFLNPLPYILQPGKQTTFWYPKLI